MLVPQHACPAQSESAVQAIETELVPQGFAEHVYVGWVPPTPAP
jgi:hypothetical protein